jgi:N-carbamoylputrescine amidase
MKIAGIQYACSDDIDSNVEKALKIMDMALQEDAKIICFQELFNTIWFPRDRDSTAFGLAMAINDRPIKLFQRKAKAYDVIILLPIFEKADSRYFNSCVVIGNDGEIIGSYRKVHVQDIPLWEERYYFSIGNTGFPVFETKYGRIGIQISWDNLLPEGSRILGLKGADIIFAPTACAFKSQHIWQTVISGNAITNGLYIMRINRAGSEDAHDFYGMSFCVNPEGELIGGPTGAIDSVLIADIDFEYLRVIRREWPLLKERRPKLYKDILMEV